jgi:hypothetical protein
MMMNRLVKWTVMAAGMAGGLMVMMSVELAVAGFAMMSPEQWRGDRPAPSPVEWLRVHSCAEQDTAFTRRKDGLPIRSRPVMPSSIV